MTRSMRSAIKAPEPEPGRPPLPDDRRHSRMAATKIDDMGSLGRWPKRSNRSSSELPDQNFSSNCSALAKQAAQAQGFLSKK